jgi:hypothetical protein
VPLLYQHKLIFQVSYSIVVVVAIGSGSIGKAIARRN